MIKEKITMKTSQEGRGIAHTVKRIARMYCEEMKRAMERHERGNLTLVTLLIAVLLLASCGNGSSDNSTNFVGQHVHIVGSSALLPLAAQAAKLFHQQHPEVKIDAQGGGSVVGLNSVTSHQSDVGDSDIYADPTIYPDPNLTDHIVCITPMTLIVNPEVSITSLTTQQVINIYTGVTTNWKDVGGPDLPIVPLVKPTVSGTRSLFDKYVLGTTAEVGQSVADASSTVVKTVAQTPGAIAYTSAATIDSAVRPIALDGISATAANIQSGKYHFWGFEHMYTLDNNIDATTTFLDFMQTPQIQNLAKQFGYLSVSTISAKATI
jgi:phosphate transport system substrate-binding protein